MQNAGPSDNPLADVFSAANPDSRMLDRIIRAREACTRAWERAFRRMIDLIVSGLKAAEALPVPPRAPSAKRQPAPQPEPVGFVPEDSPVPFMLRNVSQEIHPNMSKEERERILALRL
jgi:hypothetical protein